MRGQDHTPCHHSATATFQYLVAAANVEPLDSGFAAQEVRIPRGALHLEHLFAIEGFEQRIEVRLTLVVLLQFTLQRLVQVLDGLK